MNNNKKQKWHEISILQKNENLIPTKRTKHIKERETEETFEDVDYLKSYPSTCSTIVNDLLLEDNNVKRWKYTNYSRDCYRCRHFSTTTELNLRLLKWTDLNLRELEVQFLQAIESLLSATKHFLTTMKTKCVSLSLDNGEALNFNEKNKLLNENENCTQRTINSPNHLKFRILARKSTPIPENNNDILINDSLTSLDDSNQEKSVIIPESPDNINQRTFDVRDSAYDTFTEISQYEILSQMPDSQNSESVCHVIRNQKNIEIKQTSEKITSVTEFNFIPDELCVNNLSSSLKIILSVLTHEHTVKMYMSRNSWKDSLESKSVEVILDFCDLYGARYCTGSDMRVAWQNCYVMEIIQCIKNIFEEMLGADMLNKINLWSHRIAIILELCSYIFVCVDVIDYLINKLEILLKPLYIDYQIKNKIFIILNSTDIIIQKLQVVIVEHKNVINRQQRPIIVTDLWKKWDYIEQDFVMEMVFNNKQNWINILDNLMNWGFKNDLFIAAQCKEIQNKIIRI